MNPYLFMATIFACLFAVSGMYSSSAIQDEYQPHVSFVNIKEGSSNNQFYVMTVETAIESPVQQQAVVTIYVQDPDTSGCNVIQDNTIGWNDTD